jgi:hypothetical protein
MSMAAAANLGVAQVPFTDGDMIAPELPERAGAEEVGGGSGEPGRAKRAFVPVPPSDGDMIAPAEAEEAAPRAVPRAAPELWTDRG